MRDLPKKTKDLDKVASRVLKKVENSADAGAMWLTGLDPVRKYQLIDFSGQLSQLVPMSQSHISESKFIKKLANAGHYEPAIKMLKRLVGDLQGWIGPYDIWWAHRYCHYYVMYLRQGHNEDESKEKVAEKLKFKLSKLLSRISRRDIHSLVNMLLLKSAEESEGHIAMGVAIRASEGSVKDTELFYRYVKRKDADLGGDKELDPTIMTEEELQSHIKKMKKQMGMSSDSEMIEESTDG